MYRGISYLLIIAFVAFATEVTAVQSCQDTTKKYRLDSVMVKSAAKTPLASSRAFAVGTNIQRIPQESMDRIKSMSLSDLLKEQASVYIKEYGRGMASYVSVRGTSSSHTSIAWNGMSLSVPTLGQANLSQIPLYFFDRMDLHIGGSGMLYGDGSIGGSIQLSTLPLWKKGVSGDLLFSGGSFSTLYGAGTLRYSNGKTESRSSLFYTSAKNDFMFANNTKPGHPKERLNNSSYENLGAMQEVYRKFRDSSILSFTVWYLNHDREIQPSVSLNDRPETYASVNDRNIRGAVNYINNSNFLNYRANISYSNDYQLYKEDVIESSKFSAVAETEYGSGAFIFKAGFSAEHTVPSAGSFADSVTENRFYIYGMARYSPLSVPGFMISAGIRGGQVTNGEVPVMPSLEVKYTLLNKNGHTLATRGAFSASGRVPTLNDRYWGGIHTYLLSEKSNTVEGGVDYSWFSGNDNVKGYITLYNSEVENWIRWLPAGQVWRPQNIPVVLSRGAEVGASFGKKLGGVIFELNVDYSYTSIKMVEGLRENNPSQGRQLAFQPKHSARAALSAHLNKLAFYANMSFSGERSTLDIYDILDPYFLIDIGAQFESIFLGHRFVVNAVIKNLTGVSYQNVKFYAMPGRNWNLSLRFYF